MAENGREVALCSCQGLLPLEDTFLFSCPCQPDLPLRETLNIGGSGGGCLVCCDTHQHFGKSPEVHLKASCCFLFWGLMEFQFGGFSLFVRRCFGEVSQTWWDLEVKSGAVLPFVFWISGHLFGICFVFGDFPLVWFGLADLLWFVSTDFWH